MIKDIEARETAVDPYRSFIVQAPAGSGKTEILTQRFLCLLGLVESPEQIVALTFTRKAASEMRERILKALERASKGRKPLSTHEQKTYDYATRALHLDKSLKWDLLNQPSRLRITTIDSLCQRLVQAMPMQSNACAFASISDSPFQLYRNAAHQCLNYLISNQNFHAPLGMLLKHFDNQQERLLDLFCDLLGQRDQWLNLIHEAREQEKSTFEEAISWIEKHELARLNESLPNELKYQIIGLVQQFAGLEKAPDAIKEVFQTAPNFSDLGANEINVLSNILLTKSGSIRKKLDQHAGFPSSICVKHVYQDIKKQSELLFTVLSEHHDFIEALNRVKNLPPPYYDPSQWEVLQSLFIVLPILAAHLSLLFKERNEVDFTSISISALDALGDDEAPTDLALFMDHQICHLLIDEFQDTSIQQFQLISKLTQGWQQNDGKTLFVVGDPMQSIYRFRAAEVGLFLKAQQHGIGSITLTPLQLSCNFRSTENIINWVNKQFKFIFPKTNDIESGAVTFHQSDIIQPAAQDSFITATHFDTKEKEANAVIDLVQKEQETYKNDSVAILVRSRKELYAIMAFLRKKQIPFQGIDIDPLSNLPHLMDVWSLTKALLMPSNRLNWLAFLRSPWCGIPLKDLHTLANIDPKKSIPMLLKQGYTHPDISPSGQMRFHYIQKVLNSALEKRYQLHLSDWVMKTLNQLNSKDVLGEKEMMDLEQFYKLLDRFDHMGQITDFEAFEKEFNKLYSQQITPSNLQIMTIHKSKGLEFDAVILPGLGAKSPNISKPLLRWLKLPTEYDNLLLVSPVKAVYQDSCQLYDYLELLDKEKENYESQRLLYVAATRAKKRLHLFDYNDKVTKGTFRDFLSFVTFQQESDVAEEKYDEKLLKTTPDLYRLPDEYYNTTPIFSVPTNTEVTISLDSNIPRLTGIAAHTLLQWIATYKPAHSKNIPWYIATQYLSQAGLVSDELEQATDIIKNQIQKMIDDPVGQWILGHHLSEANELELLVEQDSNIKTRIIDRTFIEDEKLWIIDYKTGDESQEAVANHQEQVEQYAALLSHSTQNTIHCGLYYLSTSRWISWPYSGL